MKFKIVYAPEVKLDVQDAINWYDMKQNGLAKQFVNELKKLFNAIKKSPESVAIRYSATRCRPMKKFPYMVHYRLDNENNTILC